jgi:hypothetical protein
MIKVRSRSMSRSRSRGLVWIDESLTIMNVSRKESKYYMIKTSNENMSILFKWNREEEKRIRIQNTECRIRKQMQKVYAEYFLKIKPEDYIQRQYRMRCSVRYVKCRRILIKLWISRNKWMNRSQKSEGRDWERIIKSTYWEYDVIASRV